jgi:3-hydroxyacyl-CoA dehydrogenase/enoyl-CoA hydratase/3-hydroxybutyryl-CoA epimerase
MSYAIELIAEGEVAYLEFDLQGEKVNKLSAEVMLRLAELVEKLKTSSYKAVVLISNKKDTFIAGADIEAIKSFTQKDQFRDAINQAHSIFNAVEDLPMPTLAAIDGVCLGGGCELALACDYRIGSDNKKTQIGLPEVKLGIFPGFGGCYRLPRLIGLPNSLDIILAGKSVVAKKALKVGLLDAMVPKERLREYAHQWALDMAGGKKKKRKRFFKARSPVDLFLHSLLGKPMVFSKAKEALLKQSKGFYPAPLAALEVVQEIYGMTNREQALAYETDRFVDVAVSDISKQLINLFFILEALKKKNGVDGDVSDIEIDTMAVLGAGVMGGGIAYVAADKGVEVRMKDIANDALARGFKAARDLWDKKLKRRRINRYEFEQKMSLVTGTLDYSGFGKMDLVIEAVIEDINIKKTVIAETVSHLNPNCIFATNTSSLSVTEMATAHPRPENFVGMHFFNPVDKMPLVEIIRGEKTSDRATAAVFELAKKMGKTPVVVKDGPGFLVNRLLLPLLSEALFLLEDGADIVKTDRIYTHEFGLPMGPFRLMDEVGHDVCVKVLKIFQQSLGERIQISPLIKRVGLSGRLGKKSFKGFYLYDEKGKEEGLDPDIYNVLGLATPTTNLSSKECVDRGLLLMINEASRALYEDHIVETPAELDLAMIMGTGFPPFRGGLLRYADSLGAKTIVEQLNHYSSQQGIRFSPSDSIRKMAEGEDCFYS